MLVNKIRKKIRVESEKNVENNNYPSEKYDEPVSSSKTPCSSKPSKDEMVSNLSLFSRQSSCIGSSNIRSRLSMSGLDDDDQPVSSLANLDQGKGKRR